MNSDVSGGLPIKGRPLPAQNQDTAFFWEGTRLRKLLAQRCSKCGLLRHPPGPACPRCHSFDWFTTELSHAGELYSYSVPYHPLPPGFDSAPVVAVISLDEDVRIVSNVVGADPATLTIGEPLEAFFVDQAEGWTAVQYRRPQRARA